MIRFEPLRTARLDVRLRELSFADGKGAVKRRALEFGVNESAIYKRASCRNSPCAVIGAMGGAPDANGVLARIEHFVKRFEAALGGGHGRIK